MDKVHRQTDESFLLLINNFWCGNVIDEQAHYIVNKWMDIKTDEEKIEFKDDLHLVPMWKLSHLIVLK